MTDNAAEMLRNYLKPGDEVYLVLEHLSQSGMARDIKPYAITDGRLYHLSHLVEAAGIAKRRKNRDGVRLGGTGMDMGFHLVYSLGMLLYNDGYTFRHRWL